MKTLFAVLTFIVFLSSGWTIDKNATDLEWNDKTLSWDDFAGDVNPYSTADAATSVRIVATPYFHHSKIHYRVNTYFIREHSWYRNRSEQLLSHEQLHFDLAELYARKVRKKISEYQRQGVRDVHAYNAAIQRILDESNRIDVNYDERTLHGCLSEKQALWKKNIWVQLKALEPFSKENSELRRL